MKLIELTEKRRLHIQSSRNNDDHSHEIIADLYSDPSHFFYEILQNADDAIASEVYFNLKDDCLEILHNGEKLFNFDDIKSITTVGSSTKKNNVNSIGKFGAGFKSVFSITISPQIHSGDYHFRITDFIVPEEIEPVDYGNNTFISIPFNHPKLSKNILYDQITKRLKTLEAESLIFLKNIRKIKWNNKEENGCYLGEIKDTKAYITTIVNDNEEIQEYLIFNKNINIEMSQLKLVVAYLLDSETNKLIPLSDKKLFVFFPTNEETRLKFLVHAPYKTNPSRETIPFIDEQNKVITTELSNLIAESIFEVKSTGYLDVDFLSMLPISSEEDHPIYKAAFCEVKKIIKNHEILPAYNENTYTSSENSILAGERKLSDLLDINDNFNLFGRTTWLSTSITEKKSTRNLRDYLIKEIEIPEISTEKFCSLITMDFIKKKSDDWIIDFYSTITANETLYKAKDYRGKRGILREKPIIRLEDGSHISSENELGEIQVYLPSEQTSKFRTVKKTIAKNEKAKELFKKIGIKEPDQISEIKEFIFPIYNNKSAVKESESKDDFDRVFSIWLGANEYKQKEIIDTLKQLYFIGGRNHAGLFVLEKPENIYLKIENLRAWFDENNVDNVIFLDEFFSKPLYRTFLDRLGVQKGIKIYGNNDVHISQHGWYKRSINGFNPEFNIQGLKFSLERINIFRSKYLWSTIINYPSKLKGHIEFRTNQRDSYTKSNEDFSVAQKLLTQHYWLYDKSQKLIEKPLNEIMLSDLNSVYEITHENIDKLVYGLGFKLDEIKEFEEKTGKKVISQEEYDELQELRKQKENNSEAPDQPQWSPDFSPFDILPAEDTSPINILKTPYLGNQEVTETKHGEKPDTDKLNTTPHNSQDIGDWGELFAKQYLDKKYPNDSVIWMNENGNIGEGYDFVIRDKQKKDIKYYEIKTKINNNHALLEISKSQWGWAKRLHEEGNGEKYILLVVAGAGTKQATLKLYPDPVKLWKEGKIEAQPINLKL